MKLFAAAQMTPEERQKMMAKKLEEKKAELAAKKVHQEAELKAVMIQMKKDGKTVDEIKAVMLDMKKKFAAGETQFFSIQDLRQRPGHLDQTKLETYLSDADFKKIFLMTKVDFERQPKWKKESLKKDQGIL